MLETGMASKMQRNMRNLLVLFLMVLSPTALMAGEGPQNWAGWYAGSITAMNTVTYDAKLRKWKIQNSYRARKPVDHVIKVLFIDRAKSGTWKNRWVNKYAVSIKMVSAGWTFACAPNGEKYFLVEDDRDFYIRCNFQYQHFLLNLRTLEYNLGILDDIKSGITILATGNITKIY